MQLWLPPQAASPGRDRRDPPSRITQSQYDGCSRRTSRRALTRSTTRALMDRVAARIADKRRLGWSGVWPAGSSQRPVSTGTRFTSTPQGGILSPLLANIALAVLDEHFTRKWEALGPVLDALQARRQGVRPIDSSAMRTTSW